MGFHIEDYFAVAVAYFVHIYLSVAGLGNFGDSLLSTVAVEAAKEEVLDSLSVEHRSLEIGRAPEHFVMVLEVVLDQYYSLEPAQGIH